MHQQAKRTMHRAVYDGARTEACAGAQRASCGLQASFREAAGGFGRLRESAAGARSPTTAGGHIERSDIRWPSAAGGGQHTLYARYGRSGRSLQRARMFAKTAGLRSRRLRPADPCGIERVATGLQPSGGACDEQQREAALRQGATAGCHCCAMTDTPQFATRRTSKR